MRLPWARCPWGPPARARLGLRRRGRLQRHRRELSATSGSSLNGPSDAPASKRCAARAIASPTADDAATAAVRRSHELTGLARAASARSASRRTELRHEPPPGARHRDEVGDRAASPRRVQRCRRVDNRRRADARAAVKGRRAVPGVPARAHDERSRGDTGRPETEGHDRRARAAHESGNPRREVTRGPGTGSEPPERRQRPADGAPHAAGAPWTRYPAVVAAGWTTRGSGQYALRC